jgi:hypothetical protein
LITKDELEMIMGDIDDDFWKEILEECDTDKDGMVINTFFIYLISIFYFQRYLKMNLLICY